MEKKEKISKNYRRTRDERRREGGGGRGERKVEGNRWKIHGTIPELTTRLDANAPPRGFADCS